MWQRPECILEAPKAIESGIGKPLQRFGVALKYTLHGFKFSRKSGVIFRLLLEFHHKVLVEAVGLH